MERPRFDPDSIPDLDPPENTIILKKYVRHCELKRIAPTTIANKVERLRPFLRTAGIKADLISAETIEDYFLERMGKLSPATVDRDVIEFRVFYKWLLGRERMEKLLENIKKSGKKRALPTDKILTRADVQAMLAVAERQRDRALVSLTWDSAVRISGLLALNVGNIEFDHYGAAVIVEDKTGRRRLRLTSSVPDLQRWIEQHPYHNDPVAPLFVTSRSYSGGRPRRMAVKTTETLFNRLGKLAKLGKPTNPHALRHARLTDLAREGLSEMELRIVGGWSRSSNMPEVYVHLSGADVEKKILRMEGVLEEEDLEPDAMHLVKCPRCKEKNAPGSRYCNRCWLPLLPESIREVEIVKSKITPTLLQTMIADVAAGCQTDVRNTLTPRGDS